MPAGVEWLSRRPDVDPNRIGVVGISMGGMEAIGAAGEIEGSRRSPPKESTRRSARDLGRLPEANGVEGDLELGITWLQNEVTALLAGGNPPIPLADSAATALETAFLLFTANSPSEIDTAELLIRGASPSIVTVTVLPNVDHGHGLAEAPET